MPDLIVVGTIAYDSIETPYGKRERALGGSASYFSYAASFFTSVGVVGIVGRDFPKNMLDAHRKQGIDLSGVVRDENGKTFFWSGSYCGDMNSATTHETQLNVFADFEPKLSREFSRAPFVFLANSHPCSQMAVIEQVEGDSLICCDSMNYWITSANNELKSVLSRVDGFFCNDAEARMLTGVSNLILAGKKLLELGPSFVVIKKGEHGSMLVHRDGLAVLPAYPLEQVFDPTGAGDTFAGGFMGALAKSGDSSFRSMKDALIHATISASFTCQGFGLESLIQMNAKAMSERKSILMSLLPRV